MLSSRQGRCRPSGLSLRKFRSQPRRLKVSDSDTRTAAAPAQQPASAPELQAERANLLPQLADEQKSHFEPEAFILFWTQHSGYFPVSISFSLPSEHRHADPAQSGGRGFDTRPNVKGNEMKALAIAVAGLAVLGGCAAKVVAANDRTVVVNAGSLDAAAA